MNYIIKSDNGQEIREISPTGEEALVGSFEPGMEERSSKGR